MTEKDLKQRTKRFALEVNQFCERLPNDETSKILRRQLKYWFAFHPHQKETIAKYPQGYGAFGCGSAELIVFIPAKALVDWHERFWTTELEDRFYWHVRIVGDKAKLTTDTKAGFKPVDVTQYLVQ